MQDGARPFQAPFQQAWIFAVQARRCERRHSRPSNLTDRLAFNRSITFLWGSKCRASALICSTDASMPIV
jgi:hypothetical protein